MSAYYKYIGVQGKDVKGHVGRVFLYILGIFRQISG